MIWSHGQSHIIYSIYRIDCTAARHVMQMAMSPCLVKASFLTGRGGGYEIYLSRDRNPFNQNLLGNVQRVSPPHFNEMKFDASRWERVWLIGPYSLLNHIFQVSVYAFVMFISLERVRVRLRPDLFEPRSTSVSGSGRGCVERAPQSALVYHPYYCDGFAFLA